MNKPLISILISTYNWPCFKLAGQLEELVTNETEDIEIIVGEDASTDPNFCMRIKKLRHCPTANMCILQKIMVGQKSETNCPI